MRIASFWLFLIAGVLAAFAWWGLFSSAGQQRFDEMDGMYPFFGGVTAAAFALAGATLLAVDLVRRKRRSRR